VNLYLRNSLKKQKARLCPRKFPDSKFSFCNRDRTKKTKKFPNTQKYDEFATVIIEHVKQCVIKDITGKDEFIDWYINRDKFVKTFLPYAPIAFSPYDDESWKTLRKHLYKQYRQEIVVNHFDFRKEDWQIKFKNGKKGIFSSMEILGLKIWSWKNGIVISDSMNTKIQKINFDIMKNWKEIPSLFRPHAIEDWASLYRTMLELKTKFKFKWTVTFNENEREFIFTKPVEEHPSETEGSLGS